MDLKKDSNMYIDSIIGLHNGPKAMIFDKETLEIAGLSKTFSEFASKEVLFHCDINDIVSQPFRDDYKHLCAFFFLSPSAENVLLIERELENPHFSKYDISFNNCLDYEFLNRIAKKDALHMISRISEVFLSYFPVTPLMFHINIPDTRGLRESYNDDSRVKKIIDRMVGFCYHCNATPYVRYDAKSGVCHHIAEQMVTRINDRKSIFAKKIFSNDWTLIILDRARDCITPLLHHWFYQSMIYDLFDVYRNIVDIDGEKISLDERIDSVLASFVDKFFGTVLLECEEKLRDSKSIPDKTNLPGIIEYEGTASKALERKIFIEFCLKLVDKMVRMIDEKSFAVSSLEQEIILSEDIESDSLMEKLSELISSDHDDMNLLRVVLIYLYRFDGRNIDRIISKLKEHGKEDIIRNKINCIADYAKIKYPVVPKHHANYMEGAKSFKDIDPDKVQKYTSMIDDILSKLKSDSLSKDDFPFVNSPTEDFKPRRVIMFVVGPVTYEESRIVSLHSGKSLRVILGGTSVSTARSFIENELTSPCS